MATPRRRAYTQNHAAELLKKPEELGLRTGPRSRAARETRTGVEGVTTQGRPTELPTPARRSREARNTQSSRWTCHNIHIPAKYKYYIGLHYIALHCMVFHCIASYWIAWDGLRKNEVRQSRHHHLSVHLLHLYIICLLFREPPSTVFQARLLPRRQRLQLRPDARTITLIVVVELSQTKKAIRKVTRFVHGRPHQAGRTKACRPTARLASIVPAMGLANIRIPLHVAQQLQQWLQLQQPQQLQLQWLKCLQRLQ